MKGKKKVAPSHVEPMPRVRGQKPKGLTGKQELFVQRIVAGDNITQAAIASGVSPGSAGTLGSRWLKKSTVVNRIEQLRELVTERAIERTVVDRAWILNRLIENVNRAMRAEAVTDRDGQKTGEYVYQGSVANRALELLGKEHGMFVETVRVKDLSALTEAELEQLVRGEIPPKLKLA